MIKDTGTYADVQRMEQLSWLLFLKIIDDSEKEKELVEDKFKSPMPENLRWRNWAGDEEGLTGDKLLMFVNNNLFPTLKELPVTQEASRANVIREMFQDTNNLMTSGTLLRQVINKINAIDFNNSKDRHVFGDIYEKILKDLQSAGNAGEFYTPRAVTRFMVEMIDPKINEKVLDPACGTGGFLTGVIEFVREKYVKTTKDREKLQNLIKGIEKKPLPHMLCLTNMFLHGIEAPTQILRDNTLTRPLRDYGPKDRVDVVLTNPPFGGMEEDGVVNNFPSAFRTKETADLFLLLIIHILKDEGRAAIVLPDGTLFGEGVKTRIKERLLEECNLHTVVRLPNSVFAPYTSIKTNLLFFSKGQATKDIWFYEHRLPEGAKAYNKTKPIEIAEFDPIRKWWQKRTESEISWKVSAETIKKNNYNLDVKNPHVVDLDHGDPDELLAMHKNLLSELSKTRDNLKKELMTALKR